MLKLNFAWHPPPQALAQEAEDYKVKSAHVELAEKMRKQALFASHSGPTLSFQLCPVPTPNVPPPPTHTRP